MIIKIKCFKINEGRLEHEGWWIEDKIAKVRIVKTEVSRGISLSTEEADVYLPLPDLVPDSVPPVEEVIRLICRMKDGNERVIVFQGEAFLLNDEGKTIERLTT